MESRKDAFEALGTAFEDLSPHHKRVQAALLNPRVLPICIDTITAKGQDAVAFWRSVVSGKHADEAARYVRDKMLEPIAGHTKNKAYARAMAAARGWNASVQGTFTRPKNTPTVPVIGTDIQVR